VFISLHNIVGFVYLTTLHEVMHVLIFKQDVLTKQVISKHL